MQILRLTDTERRWYTVDDKRLCLICERIISGREIRVEGGPETFTLGCPTAGCPGNFSHWYLYRPAAAAAPAPAPVPATEGTGEMDFLADFGHPGMP